MSVAVALDILVAGLLVATIAYAIILNRRLGQLHGGREQLERVINDFYQATTRAELGATALKEAAGQSDTEVLEQLESLTNLRNELDFLVTRAETQSARLEEIIGQSRGPAAQAPTGSATGVAPDAALDAELFGVTENKFGLGDRRQHEPEPLPKSTSSAFEALR
jgi:hypothetical protein